MSLVKDTFFYSLAKWGQRLSALVIAPFIIAYFTPQQYGYMTLVKTLASFCSILGMLAIVDQGLPRFFIDSKEDFERQSYTTTSFFISGIGVLFITISILAFSPFISVFFNDVSRPIVFALLTALTCLAHSIWHVGGNMLKWTFKSSLFTKITLLQALTGTSIIICGILFWEWRANMVLIIMALATLCCGIWAVLNSKQFVRPSTFSKKKLGELITYSWPLLGLNIFAFFTRSLDRIFLASLTSLGTVGIFAVSSAVASVFETLVSGFFFALGPHILSTFREPGSPQRYAQLFGTITCLGLMSIVILGLWGSPIVTLLRPEGTYQQIGVYIPWIISGTLLYYLGGYLTPGPTIKKKTYWKFIGFSLAATINAFLNYLFIPRLGILGAGVATTLASLVAAIFNITISNRLYFVPSRWQFACIIILIYTLMVSLIQHEDFFFNINLQSLFFRSNVSLILIGFVILIFYRDIKASGIINTIWTKTIHKQRR